MCDASAVLCDTLHATSEYDDPPYDTLRPTTPLPDLSRTLRRTISYASIDTVCPPKNKGIRRRIEDTAQNLKPKSTKKKKKPSSSEDVPKNVTRDPTSTKSKAAKRERKTTPLFRDSSQLHKSEEECVLAIADRLHNGATFDLDPPLTSPGVKSKSLFDVPLCNEEEEHWEDYSFPTRTLWPGAHITEERQDAPQRARAEIKDVQLDIRPFETDVTIWDGLQAVHHVFKCRLLLRCTTHPYDSVSVPDIHLVEMGCNTCPAGSRYARPPVLQAAYEGSTPGSVANPGDLPDVKLSAGIHVDRVWCKVQDDNGTWGWHRDAYIPLSPRLFDKMEYREFKLVSRVWVGESCVEDELTFGISMLLRGVDMK
ncbi:hypothetical protein OG21DRAFT_1516695 [Imleria badia]|nr:hypothetical protein OG21DRAFT_1516695 [Imleria badia]